MGHYITSEGSYVLRYGFMVVAWAWCCRPCQNPASSRTASPRDNCSIDLHTEEYWTNLTEQYWRNLALEFSIFICYFSAIMETVNIFVLTPSLYELIISLTLLFLLWQGDDINLQIPINPITIFCRHPIFSIPYLVPHEFTSENILSHSMYIASWICLRFPLRWI